RGAPLGVLVLLLMVTDGATRCSRSGGAAGAEHDATPTAQVGWWGLRMPLGPRPGVPLCSLAACGAARGHVAVERGVQLGLQLGLAILQVVQLVAQLVALVGVLVGHVVVGLVVDGPAQ